MWNNYFKIAFRQLFRNKLFSLINIGGLAIAMMSSLFLFQYIYFEKSYDKFHDKRDRIYRVALEQSKNGESIFAAAANYLPVGANLKADYQEISHQTTMYYIDGHSFLNWEHEILDLSQVAFVDTSFFEVFSFELLQGSREEALKAPNTAVLTESLAQKIFGTSHDVLGKHVEFHFESGHIQSCTISGIITDFPKNAHFKLELLLSFSSMKAWPEFEQFAWRWPFYHTYICLSENANPILFQQKIQTFFKRYKKEKNQNGQKESLKLQPLLDIHLKSDLWFELSQNGNRSSLYFLCLIAFFILCIAYLNYINLSTAQALNRAKEVGLRKTVGARKRQIMQQFLVESFLVNMLAFGIALGLSQLFFRYFSTLADKPIDVVPYSQWPFWLGWGSVLFIFGLIASTYPAFFLAGFRPSSILKGQFLKTYSGVLLRQSLVVIQFAIALFLMSGTYVVFQQLGFLRDQPLGANFDPIMVVNVPRQIVNDSTFQAQVDLFRNELLTSPGIEGFTSSSSVPGKWMGQSSFYLEHSNPEEDITLEINQIDAHYFETYQIEVLAGRGFSEDFISDQHAIVINEAAMKQLGISTAEEIINKKLMAGNQEFKIIGVIKNYHHSSVKTDYDPIVFTLKPANKEFFSIKMVSAGMEGIKLVDEIYHQLFPGNPFVYFMLKEQFNTQYKSELNFGRVFGVFAIIAILISSLGLFGLATFTSIQRTKEVCVRKVLGASTWGLVRLLLNSFLRLVLLSILLTWPFVYFGTIKWLHNFYFRIPVSWDIFMIPAALALLIALLTIGYNALRTANMNPVVALRED